MPRTRIVVTVFLPTIACSLALAWSAFAVSAASATQSPDGVPVERRTDAVPDSSVVPSATAGLDSTSVDALTDSLAARRAAPTDAVADSTGDAVEALPRPGASRERAELGAPALSALRPETLEDVVEALPGASVRVAGDDGMPAFVGISPVSTTAPEIWMDGIPTRSPGDRDPALWDRSAIAVERAGRFGEGPLASPGDPGLWLESHDPRPGQMILRSRFSSTSAETFQRAVSATTPASDRVLRLDFEEWKTEEGIEYSFAPGVLARSDAGRSKMRRFRIGGDVVTDAGRVRMFFGRGRRYHRGSVLDANAHERWTGELSLAFDRAGARGTTSARAWHLDFSDVDANVDTRIDASRTGLVLERSPQRDGFSAQLSVERWSSRTDTADSSVIGPVTAVVARARAGWTGDPAARFTPWSWVEAVRADHLDDSTAFGARVGADLGHEDRGVRVLAERVLRVPNLAEVHGGGGFDAIEPLADSFSYQGRTWRWSGQAGLAPERQERVGLAVHARVASLELRAAVDHWRLREGVGWRPAAFDVAQVVGGVELDVNTVSASARSLVRAGVWSLRGAVHGQRVLGRLDEQAGRGAGWPQWNLRARAGVDRRFFSRHNRLGVDFDVIGLGPREDDVVAPLTDLRLPARWRLDARLRLSIRGAVMSLGYDNLLDTDLDDVLGTFRRGRQLRWQLDWNFTN